MVFIRLVHVSGMKAVPIKAMTSATTARAPFVLLRHQRTEPMASMASSAPRDWLPSAAIRLRNMARYESLFVHFSGTREMMGRLFRMLAWVARKYISGTVMIRATANSLLPSMTLDGGPHTRKLPPEAKVNSPPLIPKKANSVVMPIQETKSSINGIG